MSPYVFANRPPKLYFFSNRVPNYLTLRYLNQIEARSGRASRPLTLACLPRALSPHASNHIARISVPIYLPRESGASPQQQLEPSTAGSSPAGCVKLYPALI